MKFIAYHTAGEFKKKEVKDPCKIKGREEKNFTRPKRMIKS